MDGWGRPNPFYPGHISGSSHSLHAANHDRQGEHHQEQSNVQTPPLVSPTSSLSRPLAPAPAFIPNQPAIWQLGRHSWYAPGDDKTQSINDTLHEDRSPSSAPTFFTQAVDYPRDVKEVSYNLGGDNEAQLRDVEEELHRGLKARQVRHTIELTMRNRVQIATSPDLDDCTGRGHWYWACDRNGAGTQTRSARVIYASTSKVLILSKGDHLVSFSVSHSSVGHQ